MICTLKLDSHSIFLVMALCLHMFYTETSWVNVTLLSSGGSEGRQGSEDFKGSFLTDTLPVVGRNPRITAALMGVREMR